MQDSRAKRAMEDTGLQALNPLKIRLFLHKTRDTSSVFAKTVNRR